MLLIFVISSCHNTSVLLQDAPMDIVTTCKIYLLLFKGCYCCEDSNYVIQKYLVRLDICLLMAKQ